MLSKETKVDVKNKENKTACFIEIEGLLNSLELISDLPGLGVAEQQGQGSWELQEGEGRSAPPVLWGQLQGPGDVTVFRGVVGS